MRHSCQSSTVLEVDVPGVNHAVEGFIKIIRKPDSVLLERHCAIHITPRTLSQMITTSSISWTTMFVGNLAVDLWKGLTDFFAIKIPDFYR